MIKGKVLPLLRINLSEVAIFNMVLDINIQAIEEVQEENKENPSKYASIILTMGQGISDVYLVGEAWKKTFKEYKRALNNCEISIYNLLSDLYHINTRWFNTLRSTLYIMEEDLLIASQPSVVYLWDQFFKVEEDLRINFTKELKIRDTYGKFTERYLDQD